MSLVSSAIFMIVALVSSTTGANDAMDKRITKLEQKVLAATEKTKNVKTSTWHVTGQQWTDAQLAACCADYDKDCGCYGSCIHYDVDGSMRSATCCKCD